MACVGPAYNNARNLKQILTECAYIQASLETPQEFGWHLRKHRMHGSAPAFTIQPTSTNPRQVFTSPMLLYVLFSNRLSTDNTSVHNNGAYRATHLRHRCQEALLAAQLLDSVEHADTTQMPSYHRDLPYTPLASPGR